MDTTRKNTIVWYMSTKGQVRKIPITRGVQYHTQGGQFTIAHTEGFAGFAAEARGRGAVPGPLRVVYIQFTHTYNTRGSQYGVPQYIHTYIHTFINTSYLVENVHTYTHVQMKTAK